MEKLNIECIFKKFLPVDSKYRSYISLQQVCIAQFKEKHQKLCDKIVFSLSLYCELYNLIRFRPD